MTQHQTPSSTHIAPLAHRRIVVTRPRAQAQRFIDLLEHQGAEVVECPTIEIVPMASYEQLDAAIDHLARYDWLIFTSVNGVEYFTERLRARQKDVGSLQHLQIATIGPATAQAVEALGLRVHAVPEEYRAEALVTVLGEVTGKRMLLPRAAQARAVLPQELRALGAQVDEIASYQTVLPQATAVQDVRALLQTSKVDMVTFTSSSTVRNFAALFPADELLTLCRQTRIGCIGPITAETARELGLVVTVQSAVYTIPAFAEAIVDYFTIKDGRPGTGSALNPNPEP
ncbi:MAG: uroporphyrinogen-III synthase [Deltaproteobacteria bacterium]|nr:uroporphyrinogen-III synthase [Deltaproteobacteria bacterium]